MAEQTDPSSPGLLEQRSWPSQRPLLAWLGPGALVVLLVLEALLVRRWLSLPFGLAAVATAPLIIAVACAAALLFATALSCLTVHYTLDDHALTIVRGTARWVVPLAAITSVHMGATQAVLTNRLWLPGVWMGRGYVEDTGPAVFAATVPPDEAVAVHTDSCTYVLSPAQPGRFAAALQERRVQAIPSDASEPGPGYLDALLQPLPAALALLAAAANWALYVEIARWTPVMPARMPVHFNALGSADRWGPPASLLWLAQMGTAILAVNLLAALLPPLRRPVTTYLLVGTALLAQILLWLAFAALLP